jgi:hypothetical protein
MRYAHQLKPGERYEPAVFSITTDINQQFLYAIADFNPVYICSSQPSSRPRIHPIILLHMSARTRSPSFRLAPNTGSVFAREHAIFRRPAFVDELLEARWTVQDVYLKGGRLYQALDIVVVSGGEVVLDREMHSLFFTHDGAPLELPGSDE